MRDRAVYPMLCPYCTMPTRHATPYHAIPRPSRPSPTSYVCPYVVVASELLIGCPAPRCTAVSRYFSTALSPSTTLSLPLPCLAFFSFPAKHTLASCPGPAELASPVHSGSLGLDAFQPGRRSCA